MLKKKYIVRFLIKEKEIYTIIKSKRIQPTTKEISFRDKTYIIDITNPTYSKVLKLFFFIDIDKSDDCQLSFVKKKGSSKITADDIDMIIGKHIIKQLTSNLTDTAFKTNLMYVLFGLALGGAIGWIAGGFV